MAFVFRTAHAIISPNGVAYGVFLQAVKTRRTARRERVSRGKPLDTLNDFLEFYSRCRVRSEDYLNPAIKPGTERNAAISAVNQVVLALRDTLQPAHY